MISSITLRVPQGLGDIFWVYQKFIPYVREIRFEVPVSSLDPVQTRALDWCACWPGVESVRPVLEQYTITPPMPVSEALHRAERGEVVSYAANHPLEQGTRLEEIDPEFPPAWAVPMPLALSEAVETEKRRNGETETSPSRPLSDSPSPLPYVALYISGHARHARANNLWTVAQWVEFTEHFCRQRGLIDVLLLGASYDRDVLFVAERALRDRGLMAGCVIDRSPPIVMRLLKEATFLIGFQSGLGIMADNLGTPQLMMYFDYLDKLRYAWCRPGHARTKYHAFCFHEPWQQVAEQLG